MRPDMIYVFMSPDFKLLCLLKSSDDYTHDRLATVRDISVCHFSEPAQYAAHFNRRKDGFKIVYVKSRLNECLLERRPHPTDHGELALQVIKLSEMLKFYCPIEKIEHQWAAALPRSTGTKQEYDIAHEDLVHLAVRDAHPPEDCSQMDCVCRTWPQFS